MVNSLSDMYKNKIKELYLIKMDNQILKNIIVFMRIMT